jgi:apolipoprotein N-acyltransferase
MQMILISTLERAAAGSRIDKRAKLWKSWVAIGLSVGLLELPFPMAGPMPPWRSVFAWFGLVPLLCAISSGASVERTRSLRRAFLLAYVFGLLWYIGNCYWIYNAMQHYGSLAPWVSVLLLLGFSAILGLYFGFFGLGVALVQQASGSARLALVAAPIIWATLEFAAAHITSVPWDQLGDSQVDNALLSQLAPWTGVYGISFVLVAANALIAGGMVLDRRSAKRVWGIAGLVLSVAGTGGIVLRPPKHATTAIAVLIQPNLDVSGNNDWLKPGEWDSHIAQFASLAGEQCKAYVAGIPQTGAPTDEIVCPGYRTHPDLIVWPESPAPFSENDPRFQKAMTEIAHTLQAPLVVNATGSEYSTQERTWRDYVSAVMFDASGQRVGRYDKIHLVPFGEFVPFPKLFFFARKLTGRASKFDRGNERKVFRLNGHRYGFFICYEAAFADEVRQFSRQGAEVLVELSDDAWYSGTSAPWQHLNMARMRAIENRRFLLRDTNDGITATIDPYGRVRQSIPLHRVDALPSEYGFCEDVTFYTAHGDVFARMCAILAFGLVAWSLAKLAGAIP